MTTRTDVIETTAGEIAAELARRGISPSERVAVFVNPDPKMAARRPTLAEVAARMRATAVARGLTTEIFDDLVRTKP